MYIYIYIYVTYSSPALTPTHYQYNLYVGAGDELVIELVNFLALTDTSSPENRA